MRKKKTIKQLMALGIQRNDAAGFVEAYHVIKAKKKEYMLPVIMAPPPPPIEVSRRPIRTMTTVYCTAPMELCNVPSEDAEKYIKRQLARQLAAGLPDLGVYTISKRVLPNMGLYMGQSVEYRMTIDVAMPEDDLEPAQQWTKENPYLPHDIEEQYEAFRRMTIEPIRAQLHQERTGHGGGKA